MHFPARFYTGVRNTTIPNPAHLHRTTSANEFGRLRIGPADTFEGLCSDYDFGLQKTNYMKLRDVLKKFGTDFLYVASARYMGDVRNRRFVACAADGSLLWNKYVGFASQGGQNHVFVAGMRIKTSIFLSLSEVQQMALLSHSQSRIESAFKDEKHWTIKLINEDHTLWN